MIAVHQKNKRNLPFTSNLHAEQTVHADQNMHAQNHTQ
jgi:hypothetical protein